MNIFIAILFFSLAIGISKISKKFFKSYFCPLSIYGFIWGTFISLFYLRLIPYYNLHNTTKIAIFGSYFAFIIGCLTIFIASKKNEIKKRIFRKITTKEDIRYIKIIIAVTSVLGAIGSFKVFQIATNQFGFSGVLFGLVRQAWIKNNFNVSLLWGILISFNFIAAILSGYFMAIKSYKYLFCYLPFISTLMQNLVWGGRASLLSLLLFYLFSYILTKKFLKSEDKEKKYLILIGVLIFVFFSIAYVIWFLRGGASFGRFIVEQYGYAIPPQFYDIYYRTGSLAALDYHITHHSGKYFWGVNLFYPIIHQFERFGLIDKQNVLQGKDLPIVQIPVKVNIYSYLRAVYDDFGLVGTIVIPYLIGIWSTLMYIYSFKKPNLFRIMILTFIYVFLVTSVTEYYFYRTSFWISFFVGIIIVGFKKILRKISLVKQ